MMLCFGISLDALHISQEQVGSDWSVMVRGSVKCSICNRMMGMFQNKRCNKIVSAHCFNWRLVAFHIMGALRLRSVLVDGFRGLQDLAWEWRKKSQNKFMSSLIHAT